jgi:hypothetical protein
MKKLLIAIICLAVLGMAGVASASMITYVETYDPNPDVLMAAGTSTGVISWVFDITDNPGWSTPGQTFNDGSITLVVEDDGGSGDGSEKATFTVELVDLLTNSNINASAWSSAFTVDASAFSDGTISAKLTATTGDFYFRSAQLNVTSTYSEGDPDPQPFIPDGTAVPEPSTFLLLGAGLLGIGFVRKGLKR